MVQNIEFLLKGRLNDMNIFDVICLILAIMIMCILVLSLMYVIVSWVVCIVKMGMEEPEEDEIGCHEDIKNLEVIEK